MAHRQIILNMLKVRNFIIPESPEKEAEFMNDETECYLTNKINNPNEKIYVFFPKTPKVGVFTIRQYIKEMQENNVEQAIIVIKDSVTAFAKQVFIEARPLIIDYFKEDELLIDKLKHVLVPKHEILDDKEKRELLKLYKLKDAQLPKIVSSDPIVRYFGARRGQVFKITRPSETAGEYINYRIVV